MGVQQYTIKALYKCFIHSFIHSRLKGTGYELNAENLMTADHRSDTLFSFVISVGQPIKCKHCSTSRCTRMSCTRTLYDVSSEIRRLILLQPTRNGSRKLISCNQKCTVLHRTPILSEPQTAPQAELQPLHESSETWQHQ